MLDTRDGYLVQAFQVVRFTFSEVFRTRTLCLSIPWGHLPISRPAGYWISERTGAVVLQLDRGTNGN